MNWMNALCLLLGVAVGIEIAYLVMRYRFDTVAKEVRSMNEKIIEVLETNGRVIDKWKDSIDLNSELLDVLKERD